MEILFSSFSRKNVQQIRTLAQKAKTIGGTGPHVTVNVIHEIGGLLVACLS
jgi:hypothetical protein